jgi:protein TonB
MAEINRAAGIPPAQISPEHLSVRGDGPGEPGMFAFGHQRERMLPSVLGALILDVLVLVIFVVLARYSIPVSATPPVLPEEPNEHIVWIPQVGPGGGGGGGGNKMIEPPRPAELPGKEKVTVPTVKPPAPEVRTPPKPVEPPPLQPVNIPAETMLAGNSTLPGAIAAPTAPPSPSQGSGTGDGAGTGDGSGLGAGTGSGLGAGRGGGTGGGIYQPGSVDAQLVAIHQVKPNFTPDAMRARLQGTATVECIVDTEGEPHNCHIIRSLDGRFGLDEEAIKAASQWRFSRSTFKGEPVQVRVAIEMVFSLR